LREAEEADQEGDKAREKPNRQLDGQRLERRDIAPLPVMLLKLDRLLAEQLTLGSHAGLPLEKTRLAGRV
jgi:hypothetical protein